MGNRGTEDYELWLCDLAHHNASPERIIKGFIRFYVLEGYCLKDVLEDMVFCAGYDPHYAGEAMARLKSALEQVVDGAIRLEADA